MIQSRRVFGAGGGVLVGMFVVFLVCMLAGKAHSQGMAFNPGDSPQAGEVWTIGEYKDITWGYSGISDNETVKLELHDNFRIIGTIANAHIGSRGHGRYRWKVGDYQGGTATSGDYYRIKITTVTGRVYSTISGGFKLRRGSLSTTPSGAGTGASGPQLQTGPQPQAGPQLQTHPSGLQRHPSPPHATGDPDFKITDAYYDNVLHKLVAVVENQRATSMANYRGPLKIAWQEEGARHERQDIEVPYISLMSGQSKHIALTTFSWPPHKCYLRFEIEVDPDNAVTETREYNNSISRAVYQSPTPVLMLEQNKIEIGTKELRDGGTVTLDRSDIETALDRECEHTFAIKVQFKLINCGAQRADMRVAIFFGDSGRRGREVVDVSLNPGEGERYTKMITVKDPSNVGVRVYRIGSADYPNPNDLLNGQMRCSSSLVDYVGRPAKLSLHNCRVIDESGAVAGMTSRQVTLDWPGNLTFRAEVTNSPYGSVGAVRSPWKLIFKAQCQHGSEVSKTLVDGSWDYNNTPDPGTGVTRTYECPPPDKPYESCTFKVRIESTSCPTMIQGVYEKEIPFAVD